jgi:hypothetical protein
MHLGRQFEGKVILNSELDSSSDSEILNWIVSPIILNWVESNLLGTSLGIFSTTFLEYVVVST